MTILLYTASFFLVALASHAIGKFLARFRLPYITGYLFAGMLAGPFVLGLLPSGVSDDLRFIDELSLGIIAFVAGSELYLKELRPRMRAIVSNTLGIFLATFAITGTTLFFLTPLIPFTAGLGVTARIAVALLGGTILLALSPASTIAVIKEVNARGPFTRTLLSVTVMMDVVGIVLFAIVVAVASALITGIGFDGTFVLLLVIDLGAAVVAGFLTGKLLEMGLGLKAPGWIKIAYILAVGFLVFLGAFELVEYSHDNLPFEIHIEPILVAMIGGFFVTNFTSYREEFEDLLHDVGPLVYVAFFTLTGVSLKLDVLTATIGIALLLFAIRAAGIFIGSNIGGLLAGEPKKFRGRYWMGLITQAGIALGLAREVAVEFPTLGDSFATLIISVVVLNEIAGPLFLKGALRAVDEAHEPGERTEDIRDALILGAEEQSIALARYLMTTGWRVVVADPIESHVIHFDTSDVEVQHIPSVDEIGLSMLLNDDTDAVIAMLPDDDDNLRVCRLACIDCGVDRLVVRLNDINRAPEFRELGALFVDPASAMVNLLGQAVRAPQTAALLLNTNLEQEVVQITITNPDIRGTLLRDLRLPPDVLALDITRDGQSILPNGYTPLRLDDEITLIGGPGSIKEVVIRLGY